MSFAGMKVVTEEFFFSGEHKYCENNTLTTKSGTFTFHRNTYLSLDGAREFCKKKGEILAPITNWEDFYQLRNYTDSCTNLGGSSSYRVGLDIIEDKVRYFTNGEVFDERVHGPMYSPINDVSTKPGSCWETIFYSHPIVDMIGVGKNNHCFYWDHPFMCLKPAANPKVCN